MYDDIALDRASTHGRRMGSRAVRVKEPRSERVAAFDRVVSVISGFALVSLGIRRRTIPGALVALAGTALLERGLMGHQRVHAGLGVSARNSDGPLPVKRHGRAAVLDASEAIRVERSVTVNAPVEELYAFWRELENLPMIMRHLESVEVITNRRSRWRAKGPAGQRIEWEAGIINEIPNELLAWKSLDDAVVPNAGSVHFTPVRNGRSTLIRVLLEYDPPAGELGRWFARLFGEEPDQQVRADLQRFKREIERRKGSLALSAS